MDKEEIFKELGYLKHYLEQVLIDFRALYDILGEVFKIIAPEYENAILNLEKARYSLNVAIEYEINDIQKAVKFFNSLDDYVIYERIKKALTFHKHRIMLIFDCIGKDYFYYRLILNSYEFEDCEEKAIITLTKRFNALQKSRSNHIQLINDSFKKFGIK